ncbi:MAG: galactokinase [Spirochaetales bacterium]|nr:galactokinase [Spirochaetales bacterium]
MFDLVKTHKTEYGTDPHVIAGAPGVVNLLGEESYYNEGYVLQIALNRFVHVAVSPRKDNSLRFFAADTGERKRTTVSNLKYKREDRWANIPKGVLNEFFKAGQTFKGLDITIYGEIPKGIGLASSSALGVAMARALSTLLNAGVSEKNIIMYAAKAESTFIGRDKGISDQLVSCVAKKNHAVFLDLRSFAYKLLPMNLGTLVILITNSNVPVFITDNDLAERKAECEECVSCLNNRRQGTSLRDYTSADLKHGMGVVPEGIRKICLHVVEENKRVLEGRDALEASNYPLFGKIMHRSHESLRDNYEVSCPELDWLVKRAMEIDGVYGSRMIGSGLGGCTVTFLEESAMEQYYQRLSEYEHIFGFSADTILCEPAGGAGILFTNLEKQEA